MADPTPKEHRFYAVATAAWLLLLAAAALYGVHRYLVWVVGSACHGP